MAKDVNEGDIVAGLPDIARIAGTSVEGARYLWGEGRLPAVKIGPAWLANRSALEQAKASGNLRRKPGRKSAASGD